MKESIEALRDCAGDLENALTRTLGFEIPEKLSLAQAFELLTAIQDPLHTEIKTRLLTRTYALDNDDVRWTVLSVLVRFGVRFGSMKAVALDVANQFYDVLDATSDRVYTLLQDPSRFPPTRYGYLKSIVAGFVMALNDYSADRLKFVNKENFVVLDEEYNHRYFDRGSEFSGISEAITREAKQLCKHVDSYSDLPRIVSNLNHITDKEGLVAMKNHLLHRVHLIAVFNAILDDF